MIAAATVHPKPEQLAAERSVLTALLLDCATVALFLITGLAGGSLTMIAEAIRGGLLLTIDASALVVLRRIHRGRIVGLDFGTGKLEQLVNVLIAVGMLGGALWIAHGAATVLAIGHSDASPLGLALGACLNGANNLVNFVAWDTVRRTARAAPSVIMQVQVRIRLTKLVCSMALQLTITIAALATDPVVVAWSDAIGALFVTGVLILTSLRILRSAVPDLLDRSVEAATREAVTQVMDAHRPDYRSLGRFRSRRSGGVVFVEVTAGFDPVLSLAQVNERIMRIRADLAAAIPGADITILAAAHPAEGPARSLGGG